MIKASDVITPEVNQQLREARLDVYFETALAYMREQFPHQTREVNDDDLTATVRLAYSHASVRGITMIRDHLKYLVPVVHWGSYFETDPQHRAALVRAKWYDEDGNTLANPSLGQLAIEVDTYLDATAKERANLSKTATAFEHMFLRDASQCDGKACLDFMHRAFPDRTALMSATDARSFVNAAGGQAYVMNLDGADLVGYVGLALYFGYRFAKDPLHSWVYAPYHDTYSNTEAQRLALGEGVQGYITRLSTRNALTEDRRHG